MWNSFKRGFISGALGSNPIEYATAESTASIDRKVGARPNPTDPMDLLYLGEVSGIIRQVETLLMANLGDAVASGRLQEWAERAKPLLGPVADLILEAEDRAPSDGTRIVALDYEGAILHYLSAAEQWAAGEVEAGNEAARAGAQEWEEGIDHLQQFFG